MNMIFVIRTCEETEGDLKGIKRENMEQKFISRSLPTYFYVISPCTISVWFKMSKKVMVHSSLFFFKKMVHSLHVPHYMST
jgi:hypothetical protein